MTVFGAGHAADFAIGKKVAGNLRFSHFTWFDGFAWFYFDSQFLENLLCILYIDSWRDLLTVLHLYQFLNSQENFAGELHQRLNMFWVKPTGQYQSKISDPERQIVPRHRCNMLDQILPVPCLCCDPEWCCVQADSDQRIAACWRGAERCGGAVSCCILDGVAFFLWITFPCTSIHIFQAP